MVGCAEMTRRDLVRITRAGPTVPPAAVRWRWRRRGAEQDGCAAVLLHPTVKHRHAAPRADHPLGRAHWPAGTRLQALTPRDAVNVGGRQLLQAEIGADVAAGPPEVQPLIQLDVAVAERRAAALRQVAQALAAHAAAPSRR